MAISWVWCGDPTDEGARVKAGTDQASASVRVATSASMSGYISVAATVTSGVLDALITGLDPNTQYYYLVDDGDYVEDPDPAWLGKFRTVAPSGAPWSGRVAVIGDAGAAGPEPHSVVDRVSDRPTFDTIGAYDPDLIIHLGDFNYRDFGSGVHVPLPITEDSYRQAIVDVLTFNETLGPDARQGKLYREHPISLVEDNHDYGWDPATGGSSTNTGGSMPYKELWSAAYYAMVPHTALPDGEAVYHSIRLGRVLVVQIDGRYYRDPNTNPDGPNKTMLGQNQRAWLENLVSTTDAEAMVFCSPQQWLTRPTESDGWNVFQDEQQWVVDTLHNNGFTGENTVIVSASMHALGLDTGTNARGGYPTFLMAAVDASGASVIEGLYDTGPTQPGRGQWGSLDIDDDGTRIRITGTGWVEDAVWRTHAIEIYAPIDVPEPPDPNLPAPITVAEAKIRDVVNFVGINDATGRIIADLPEMETGTIGRLLTAYASSKLTYPLVQSGPGGIPIETLLQATRPQRTSIVAIVNDLPVWGGRVLERVGGSGKDLTLPCVTSEQYLLNRLVTDREFVNTDRALVAQELLSDAGSIDQGPGMALEVDVTLTGDLIDRTYKASDQMTVYDALRALATGGLEWTIDLDYESAAGTVIRRIMRLGPRIGRVGVDVPLFESDGPSDSRYTLDENYTSDRYANAVSAYGTGQGEDLPQSATVYDQAALDSGAPVVHKAIHVRDTNDPVELLVIAQAELDRLKWGAELWALDSLFNAFPRLGFDAGLGDDVNWDLIGPRHPHGVEGAGRMIGWDLDLEGGRWSPKLLDPHDEEVV